MTGVSGDGGPIPGLELELPRKPEFVRTARHAVAALVRLYGAPEDLVEDIKLAVSEACNTALARVEGSDEASLQPVTLLAGVTDRRIAIEVIDPNGIVPHEVTGSPSEIDTEDLPFDRMLSLPIVRGLVDEVSITAEEPRGARMRMIVSFTASAEAPLPS
jgi:serine/threonine-protein kinase RsbW